MAHKFREIAPKRTFKRHYSDYHKYKRYLAEDFNHHCGYTHSSDKWFGGVRNFQIDHFKPYDKYPELETEYGNLVYSCSYVNRLKSDKEDCKFLDPCDVDYNEHFERDDNGYIVGKSEEGKFMVKELSLNLCRYAYIWQLERLESKIEELKSKVNEHPELKNDIYEMCFLRYEYFNCLSANL